MTGESPDYLITDDVFPEPTEAQKRAFERVMEDVAIERSVQDARWGGDDHDDLHDPSDWTAFIVAKLGEAVKASCYDETFRPADYRQALVQVAALAVAALESHDRTMVGMADTE